MSTTATDVNPAAVSIVPPGVLLITLLLVAAACGESSRAELSPEGERGRRIADAQCASCHGPDGSGGVAPQLAGLYDSQVMLSDGSTVVADDAYIRRSIIDPDAQRVEGYTLKMPVTGLSDDEIEAVLAYIRELGPPP